MGLPMDNQSWPEGAIVECVAVIPTQPTVPLGSNWRVFLDMGGSSVWLAPEVGAQTDQCICGPRDCFALDGSKPFRQQSASAPVELTIGPGEEGWQIWLRRPNDAAPLVGLSPVDARMLAAQLIKAVNVIMNETPNAL